MTTLSGGELQRIKLADNLYRKGELYIIDEPTDGLHLDDIQRLLALFNEMTERGNTLILIEHSLDVMKNADYLIELGPGGGESGGRLLYAGEPKGILASDGSVTRKFL
jgi:excinuclease UvrABC ATPase subunit